MDANPPNIGTATLSDDGTLLMFLKYTDKDGVPMRADCSFSPKNPDYHKAIAHIGGIKPGEAKPAPPFDDN